MEETDYIQYIPTFISAAVVLVSSIYLGILIYKGFTDPIEQNKHKESNSGLEKLTEDNKGKQ